MDELKPVRQLPTVVKEEKEKSSFRIPATTKVPLFQSFRCDALPADVLTKLNVVQNEDTLKLSQTVRKEYLLDIICVILAGCHDQTRFLYFCFSDIMMNTDNLIVTSQLELSEQFSLRRTSVKTYLDELERHRLISTCPIRIGMANALVVYVRPLSERWNRISLRVGSPVIEKQRALDENPLLATLYELQGIEKPSSVTIESDLKLLQKMQNEGYTDNDIRRVMCHCIATQRKMNKLVNMLYVFKAMGNTLCMLDNQNKIARVRSVPVPAMDSVEQEQSVRLREFLCRLDLSLSNYTAPITNEERARFCALIDNDQIEKPAIKKIARSMVLDGTCYKKNR